MKGLFFDILVLISATVWLMKLALSGRLTADQTALFLVGITVFVGISRAFKVGVGRLLFRVGLPIASLLTFAITYGNNDINQMTAILGGVLTLVIMLVGILIMFSGPFRNK